MHEPADEPPARDRAAGEPAEPERALVGSGRIHTARATVATVAAALFVVLALVKPWGGNPPPEAGPPLGLVASPAGSEPSEATGPGRSADTAAAAGDFDRCPDAGDWLIVTDDQLLGQSTRSWTVVSSVASAAGPADPSIPVTDIVTTRLDGIGFCAPDTTGGWRGTLWKLGATSTIGGWQATAHYDTAPGNLPPLAPPPIVALGVVATGAGRGVRASGVAAPTGAAGSGTEGPPSRGRASAASPGTGWPSGHYVLEVHTAAGGSVWIGVDLEGAP